MNARQVPAVAAGIAMAATGLTCFPTPTLEFVRSSEPWRLLTAQFIHWTPGMAILDLGAALGIAIVLERRSRLLAVSATLVGLVATASCVALLLPTGSAYRGASGIATALYAALAIDTWLESRRTASRLLPLLSLAFFATKSAWELATGVSLFAGALPGVRVASEVHLGAACGGCFVALAVRTQWLRARRRSADRDARSASGCSEPKWAARISAQRSYTARASASLPCASYVSARDSKAEAANG